MLQVCFRYASAMFQPCFSHVSAMFRTGFGQVSDRFRTGFGQVMETQEPSAHFGNPSHAGIVRTDTLTARQTAASIVRVSRKITDIPKDFPAMYLFFFIVKQQKLEYLIFPENRLRACCLILLILLILFKGATHPRHT